MFLDVFCYQYFLLKTNWCLIVYSSVILNLLFNVLMHISYF
uniref:Uncharacterized protein n=1 Tax=Arundo donax TaxID=35708 RepID=A0A0A9C1E0_ARUDO